MQGATAITAAALRSLTHLSMPHPRFRRSNRNRSGDILSVPVQEHERRFAVNRPREGEALTIPAAHGPKLARLNFRLDPFRDDADLELACDVDQALNDNQGRIGRPKPFDERAGDNDLVHRHLARWVREACPLPKSSSATRTPCRRRRAIWRATTPSPRPVATSSFTWSVSRETGIPVAAKAISSLRRRSPA